MGEPTNSGDMDSGERARSNAVLLAQIDRLGTWFHAKKSRPIWVKPLEREELVPTLEGIERVPAGNYLCRGEANDLWPQEEKKLRATYVMTGETDEQGWVRCEPNPDALGVMAAEVDHPFSIQAQWGKLQGKARDFVVKSYAYRTHPHPDDVWIVDHRLFQATYQRVAD